MICFNCGHNAGEVRKCPECGANLKVYRDILYASVAAYNEGLSRARVRDLTGALESLHKSLRFDKFNTTARNLLGLVYYEMGQSAYALREWVVSKNFQPKNNPVDAYLDEVQRPGILNRMDQMTQKFNQSITYCKGGNQDLAKIQLKRIIRTNPKMVEAHQLLALILMQEGHYEEARRYLIAASRVDAKNPLTLSYLEETRIKGKTKRKTRKQKPSLATEEPRGAHETISPLPKSGIFEFFDNYSSGFVNIIAGMVLGILVAVFLIVPTLRQNENNDAQNALVNANKEAADTANTVAALKKEVKSLKKELKNYTGKGNLKDSYEKLFEAQAALEEEDIEAAAEALSIINAKLLEPKGRAAFDTLNTTVGEELAKDAYESGYSAYRARRYDDAKGLFSQVVEYDPKYKGGAALYYLAQAFEYSEDFAGAGRYYAKYAELYPNTSRGNAAKSKAEEFGAYQMPVGGDAATTGAAAGGRNAGNRTNASNRQNTGGRQNNGSRQNAGNSRNTGNGQNAGNRQNAGSRQTAGSRQDAANGQDTEAEQNTGGGQGNGAAANTGTEQNTDVQNTQVQQPVEQVVESAPIEAPAPVEQTAAPVETPPVVEEAPVDPGQITDEIGTAIDANGNAQ